MTEARSREQLMDELFASDDDRLRMAAGYLRCGPPWNARAIKQIEGWHAEIDALKKSLLAEALLSMRGPTAKGPAGANSADPFYQPG